MIKKNKLKKEIEKDLMEITMKSGMHIGHYDIWLLDDLVEYILNRLDEQEKETKNLYRLR